MAALNFHLVLLLVLASFALPLVAPDEILPDDVTGGDAPEEDPPAAQPIIRVTRPPQEEEQRPHTQSPGFPWQRGRRKKASSSTKVPPKVDPDLLVRLPGGPGEGRGGAGGGQVLGLRWTSTKKRKFKAFLKVPYAQPPLGHLRFLPPQPALPWEGIRHRRVQDLAPCAQMDFNMDIKGVEDCLYLNIYTPAYAAGSGDLSPTSTCATNTTDFERQENSLHPVMVWIHGGGFFAGTGNPDLYGPEHLMDEDIVLVTLNYRLGPVGFLTFENDLAPGNLGLRDQIMALEWVRDNIVAFGGDPGRVTVFGESAGSMSIMFLLVSPMAKVSVVPLRFFYEIIRVSILAGLVSRRHSSIWPICLELHSLGQKAKAVCQEVHEHVI